MHLSSAQFLQLELFLVFDAILLLFLLRPKKPIVYSLQNATRSFNSHRRMFGQEDLVGVSNLIGNRIERNSANLGPLTYG